MSSAQNQDTYTKKFNHDASIWLCDGYSAAIRFISIKMPDGTSRLLAGAIFCSPLPHEKDHSFQLETPTLIAGQEQLQNIDKASLLKIVTAATRGELIAYSSSFKLVATSSVVEHSDLPSNDVWFANLNLMVTGDNIPLPTSIDRSRINGQLRVCEPAFDGLEDLCQWLGFNEIAQGQFRPYISITISPPIDLIFEKTRLSNDTFEITVDAHPNLKELE